MANFSYYIPEWEGEEDQKVFKSRLNGECDNDFNAVAYQICEILIGSDWENHCPDEIFIKLKDSSEWKKFSIEIERCPRFYIEKQP